MKRKLPQLNKERTPVAVGATKDRLSFLPLGDLTLNSRLRDVRSVAVYSPLVQVLFDPLSDPASTMSKSCAGVSRGLWFQSLPNWQQFVEESIPKNTAFGGSSGGRRVSHACTNL